MMRSGQEKVRDRSCPICGKGQMEDRFVAFPLRISPVVALLTPGKDVPLQTLLAHPHREFSCGET